MAIGIGIAIAIFNEDRDRDRDNNFGDRAHALAAVEYVGMVFWEGVKIVRFEMWLFSLVTNNEKLCIFMDV